MSMTPRNDLWPRRWVRSFLGAALATAAVGGAVWAGDLPVAQLPKDAPKIEIPKLPDVPKVDAPKGDSTKTDPKPAAPKEKLITFTMSNKPWADVMDLYANETGLAFNSVEKPPDGTFNFTPPKDPKTGQPMQYTLSRVTDIINESLLAKNFVLVRGETTFRLWPADQPIDQSLVRRVSLEELPTLAARDMVQIVLKLSALNADEQVSDVRRMMSKAGEVVPLDGQNALLMIDNARNLPRMGADLKASESADGGAAEQFSHKCVYVLARNAATHLRELLGTWTARTMDPRMTPGGFSGFGGGGFDPRFSGGGFGGFGGFQPGGGGFTFTPGAGGGGGFDPRSLDGGRGGGGRDRMRGGFTRSTGKPTKVVADDVTNTVYINGPAEKVAQGKSFIAKYDVAPYAGAEKVPPGSPEFQTYPVAAGMADGFALALQEYYRGTNVRVRALSGSQIIVYATPADHLDIIKYLNNLSKNTNEVAKTIELSGIDVSEAVLMLTKMFPAQDKGGPYIGAHPNGTGVVVRGKPEQVKDVELVLSKGINATTTDLGT